jgi:hypothetical protein
MSEHGDKTYRRWDPERYQQGSYSPAAKLSEGDLVFFLLETVPRLDLSRSHSPQFSGREVLRHTDSRLT